MRKSGILMPVFSLPSEYGIGTFGKEAYNFADFLQKAGQSYWQILPLNPTSFGDSPYQSCSAYAGNPYFIDLDMLKKENLLADEDLKFVDFGSDCTKVNYEKLYKTRYPVLKKAFENFKKADGKDFAEFCKNESEWLYDYALYMALKDKFGGNPWYEWEDGYKFRVEKTLDAFKEENKDAVGFYLFLQYEFYRQWYALKKYVNSKGIEIIGDMPIYVSYDSVEVWADPKQFDLDDSLCPKEVAGCPPDAFSKDGQLWGSPLYDWETMAKGPEPYSWWKKRIAYSLKVYDVLRIDHFRGFESYYAIKYGETTAKNGRWRKGPDIALFSEIRKDLGKDIPIIAEDLGFLTDEVKLLLKNCGFPGMKVLQFAFDSREESDYLPHNYEKNCVVYTGTHDNDTVNGWLKNAPAGDVEYAKKYMNFSGDGGFNWAMIRLAMSSPADTAVFMMPDFLGLDNSARINTPSTLGNNWQWRILSGCTNDWLARIIRDMTEIYCRMPEKEKTDTLDKTKD